MYFSAG